MAEKEKVIEKGTRIHSNRCWYSWQLIFQRFLCHTKASFNYISLFEIRWYFQDIFFFIYSTKGIPLRLTLDLILHSNEAISILKIHDTYTQSNKVFKILRFTMRKKECVSLVLSSFSSPAFFTHLPLISSFRSTIAI